jgi:hypothetical protein
MFDRKFSQKSKYNKKKKLHHILGDLGLIKKSTISPSLLIVNAETGLFLKFKHQQNQEPTLSLAKCGISLNAFALISEIELCCKLRCLSLARPLNVSLVIDLRLLSLRNSLCRLFMSVNDSSSITSKIFQLRS